MLWIWAHLHLLSVLHRSRNTASVCTELQSKVLQCYRENPQQTLHCSSLAKEYMACVQRAKVSSEQTRPLPGAEKFRPKLRRCYFIEEKSGPVFHCQKLAGVLNRLFLFSLVIISIEADWPLV